MKRYIIIRKRTQTGYLALFFTLLFITMLALQGCEPEVVTTLQLPDEEPKLALTAILDTENNEHIVFLYRSTSYGQAYNVSPEVTNGVITISDGNTTVVLSHVQGPKYRFWNADLPIVPGGIYELTAEAPGIAEKIYASCTIPLTFNPEVNLVSKEIQEGTYETLWLLNTRFRNTSTDDAWYRITGEIIMIPYLKGDTLPPESYPLWIAGSHRGLLHVPGGNNQWQDIPLRYNHHSLWDMVYDSLVPVELVIRSYRTDQDYYTFHYPFVVSGYWGGDDNPFAEPTIIHTNVKNGYGIMTGIIGRKTQIPL